MKRHDDHSRYPALVSGIALASAAFGQAPPAPVFDPPVTFTSFQEPFGLAAADIDLDGDMDVAVSNHGNGQLWVYENRGAAMWASLPEKGLKLAATYNVPCLGPDGYARTWGLTFGHFEFSSNSKDSYPDLAVAVDKAYSIWYLRNTGATGSIGFTSGHCQSLYPLRVPRNIVAADFDGDSYDDVAVSGFEVVSSVSYPRLGLVWNNSGGTFTTVIESVPFTGTGYGLDLVHAGGTDSSPTNPRDLAMTDSVNAWTYVSKDGTSETVAYYNRFESVASRGITAAILNTGDSYWDLATTGYLSGSSDLRWLEATSGTGNFLLDTIAYTGATNAYPHGVDSGKVNNDDWIDIVVANEGTGAYPGTVSVFVNGNGIESNLFPARYDFATAPPDPGPVPADTGPVQVLLVDLNGDGYLDIVAANSRDNTIDVLINGL